MLKFVVSLSSLFIASFGQDAGQTGYYPTVYNYIDADPSCRKNIPSSTCCVSAKTPQCPEIYEGAGDVDVMAIAPNVYERTEFITRNLARFYPKYYASSEWGWGGGSYASDCDQPDTLPSEPFYFMSEATQAARWNAFSGATAYSGCDRADYDSCQDAAQTSHYTCCDYCEYNTWGLCGYKYRTKGFVQILFSSNAWNDVGSEGIWCCNTAYTSSSSHCGMVFNYEYAHMGIGYYPDGGVTMVGIKDTDGWEDHVFPHGTHYDWSDDQYTFLVEFFGGKQDPAVYVDTVYLLYDGQMEEMDVLIDNGTRSDGTNGFYMLTKENTASCEPYAFVAKDTDGNWWRLPEEETYYFGTVDFPEALVTDSANCDENHYYYNTMDNANEWVANGAYNLTNSKNSDNGCVGCSKIAALETAYANKDTSTGGDDDDDDDTSTGDDDDTTTTTGDDDDDDTTTADDDDTSTCDSDTQFCCNDGCGIPTYYHNDGYYCDCSECEDEDNWDCDNCDYWASYGYDCDYVGEECGNWIYCGYTTSAANTNGDDDSINVLSDDDYSALSFSGEHPTTAAEEDDDSGSSSSSSGSNESSNSNDDGDAIDMGLLIGLIAGGVVLLLIIVAAIYFGCKRKNKPSNSMAGMDGYNIENYKPPNGVKAVTDDDIDAEKQRVY